MQKEFLYQSSHIDNPFDLIQRDIAMYGEEYLKSMDDSEFLLHYGITRKEYLFYFRSEITDYSSNKLDGIRRNTPFTEQSLSNLVEGYKSETIKHLSAVRITSGTSPVNEPNEIQRNHRTSVKPSELKNKNEKISNSLLSSITDLEVNASDFNAEEYPSSINGEEEKLSQIINTPLNEAKRGNDILSKGFDGTASIENKFNKTFQKINPGKRKLKKNINEQSLPKDLKNESENANRQTQKEFTTFKKALLRHSKGSFARKAINLREKALKNAMVEEDISWGSEEWLELAEKFFPGINFPSPVKPAEDKEEKENTSSAEKELKSNESQKQKAVKENEDFMLSETAVASEKHPDLTAQKDEEGKYILGSEEENSTNTKKENEEDTLKENTDKENDKTEEDKKNQEEKEKSKDELEKKNNKKINQPGKKANRKNKGAHVQANKVRANDTQTFSLPGVEFSSQAENISQLNNQPADEALIEENQKHGTKAEIENKAAALRADFSSKVDSIKEKVRQQSQQQQQVLTTKYETNKQTIISQSETKILVLKQKVQASRMQIEQNFAAKISNLGARLEADKAKIEQVKVQKLEKLNQEINTKKEDFSAYIQEKEAEPEAFASSEQGRIQSELESAANECIQQASQVAGGYSEESQQQAAMEVGNKSAEDIRDKIAPMQENIMELALELKGNYSEYKAKVDEELNAAEESIKPQIEQTAETTLNQLQQSHDSTVDQLNQVKEQEVQKLEMLEQTNVNSINQQKESSIEGLESNYQQGRQAIISIADKSIEGIANYHADILNSLEGDGDIYLPGYEKTVAQATIAVEQMGSTANSSVLSQSENSSSTLNEATSKFNSKVQSLIDSANTSITNLVDSANTSADKIIEEHNKKADKSIEDFETQSQETIDDGLSQLDEGIEEIKTKIEEQNQEAKDKISKKTDENIDKAKAPLYDDNRSRAQQAAEEAGKDSWWERIKGGLAAIATIAVMFIVMVVVAVIIVAALAAIGLVVSLTTVLWVIGAALLVVFLVISAVQRWDQFKNGQLSFFGYVGVVLADTLGVTDIYESVANKDIVTGDHLGLSGFERGNRFTTGAFSLITAAFGAKASFKGMRTRFKSGNLFGGLKNFSNKIKGIKGKFSSFKNIISNMRNAWKNTKGNRWGAFTQFMKGRGAAFMQGLKKGGGDAINMIKGMWISLKEKFSKKNSTNTEIPDKSIAEDADNIRNKINDVESKKTIDDPESLKKNKKHMKDDPESTKGKKKGNVDEAETSKKSSEKIKDEPESQNNKNKKAKDELKGSKEEPETIKEEPDPLNKENENIKKETDKIKSDLEEGELYTKLSEPMKESYKNLVNKGMKATEDGGVIKFHDSEGTLLIEISGGKLKYKYYGFGGDIVISEGKATTVIGKFAENPADPDSFGTRYFLGAQNAPEVKGFPEGTITRGSGKSNANTLNFLDIPDAEYNALMNKHTKIELDSFLGKDSNLDFKGLSSNKVSKMIKAKYPDMAETQIDEFIKAGTMKGNNDFWNEFNYPFLEQAFQRGDDVRLVSDPKIYGNDKKKGGYYKKELDTIIGKDGFAEKYGYFYDENTKTFKKK